MKLFVSGRKETFQKLSSIKKEDQTLNTTNHTLILKKPLFDYSKGDVFLTDEGIEFVSRMDATQGSKEYNYKNILGDYFTI